METWHVVLLALVQALTEFLPVSSSGHLALVGFFLGWPYQGITFDLALHLGTLVAVIAYFWRDLLAIARERPLLPPELDRDELEGVLSGAFYNPTKSRGRAHREDVEKPTHYKVICISMYTDDLARLDEMIDGIAFAVGMMGGARPPREPWDPN